MVYEAELTYPLETGGILMGYWVESDIVITHGVGPGTHAVHKSNGFRPDVNFHEAEIARIYEESSRLSTYLGDWHTHPGGSASLSWRDKRTMRRIANSPEARCVMPLMTILAGHELDWLAIWRLEYVGGLRSWFGADVQPLKLIVYA